MAKRKDRASIEQIDQMQAKREEDHRLRESLAAAGFEGPLEAGPVRYAICIGGNTSIGCGSMVRLDDPAHILDGEPRVPPLERSIFLHTQFHEALLNLEVGIADLQTTEEPVPTPEPEANPRNRGRIKKPSWLA